MGSGVSVDRYTAAPEDVALAPSTRPHADPFPFLTVTRLLSSSTVQRFLRCHVHRRYSGCRPSFWFLCSCQKRRQDGTRLVLPVYCRRLNAFDLFESLPARPRGILKFVVGVPGPGLLWSTAFCLLTGTAVVVQAKEGEQRECRWARTSGGSVRSMGG